jgi:predicted 3-demethylubiquinone-9 3-methyltransferase (glyoxalase superfamily)
MCAWLADRFGVSWQIVPEALPRRREARTARSRATQARPQMKKNDIAALDCGLISTPCEPTNVGR